MPTNLSLAVYWQQVSGPEQFVAHLEIYGTRVKPNLMFRSRLALELDDLLCRLFYEAESVLIGPARVSWLSAWG